MTEEQRARAATMRADRKMLTKDERRAYQAMLARGTSHEDALEDALDGVDVETVRLAARQSERL